VPLRPSLFPADVEDKVPCFCRDAYGAILEFVHFGFFASTLATMLASFQLFVDSIFAIFGIDRSGSGFGKKEKAILIGA